ncbi:MAG: tRNA dihydrouridine synthase DusB [Clostridia bacterium]
MDTIRQMNPFLLYLAPMAGFSDVTFRILCKEYGADIVTTEMISGKGLRYGSEKTAAYLATEPIEQPIVVQLFGREPDIVSTMAKHVCDTLRDALRGIDLNMGCPAPKITNNGEGSALMNEPVLAGHIIENTAKAISPYPLTVKFRKGWDDKHCNYMEFAHICEQSGAAGITVHGRTRKQQYGGSADWTIFEEIKRAVDIPVIGNGDVSTAEDMLRMRAETGVDGVMIGRAALGNPFLFAECKAALAGTAYLQPTWEERTALALRHAEMAVERGGERTIVELRKHLACYIRSVPGAAKLRTRVNEAATIAELREILT